MKFLHFPHAPVTSSQHPVLRYTLCWHINQTNQTIPLTAKSGQLKSYVWPELPWVGSVCNVEWTLEGTSNSQTGEFGHSITTPQSFFCNRYQWQQEIYNFCYAKIFCNEKQFIIVWTKSTVTPHIILKTAKPSGAHSSSIKLTVWLGRNLPTFQSNQMSWSLSFFPEVWGSRLL